VSPRLRAGAAVPAAGHGERLGAGVAKALVRVAGRPLVQHVLAALEEIDEIEAVAVAVPADAADLVRALCREAGLGKVAAVVPGGADRQASVAAALAALPPGPDLVLVHDAARPVLSRRLVVDVLSAAAAHGSATAAVPLSETVKRGEDGWVRETVERRGLHRIQTPQAFRRATLDDAHRRAVHDGFRGTDDAVLVERLGVPVRLVPGDPWNIKVTVPEDVAVAEALLGRGDGTASAPRVPRVGIGFDAHRFAAGRPLVLGGVRIDHPRGLAGHSDADVIVHAVMDALLGAAGCGDIGQHFPPTDPAYAGADSLALLRRVGEMIGRRGWRAGHVDVIVMAEAPRLAPHIAAMRAAMAAALGLDPESVNVKATTLEGMGALGREEGIAAQAVAGVLPHPRAAQ
jgi:2-C-methyl-D-erythritol 4-phosphate cytidylyltransferase/2-C-methyl-D-erythritol 2,4-cyclodiphosphate synthase